MSATDTYPEFKIGDKVTFVTVTQSARGSISMKTREGIVVAVATDGKWLSVKSKGRQYGVFCEDARKHGEKTALTEAVEHLCGKGEVNP